MKIKFLLVAVLLIAMMSCNTTKKGKKDSKSGDQTLVGTTWKLMKLNGEDVKSPQSKKEIQFTLSDSENRVSGFSGCNNFKGTFTLKGDTLTFSPLATTRMACPNQEFNEQYVLNAFKGVKTFKIKDSKLSFIGEEGKVLAVFTKLEKNQNQSQAKITDTRWELETLGGKTVTLGKNQQKARYFILKNKDNRINGFAGCNTFSGSYELKEEQQISFSKMLATLKACPDLKINDAEFLKIFEQAKSYHLEKGKLTLLDGKNEPLASFKKANS